MKPLTSRQKVAANSKIVVSQPASWTAPAERSDDGAFSGDPDARESGVALRFPPQSKTVSGFVTPSLMRSPPW
jgi:hypothetical protein